MDKDGVVSYSRAAMAIPRLPSIKEDSEPTEVDDDDDVEVICIADVLDNPARISGIEPVYPYVVCGCDRCTPPVKQPQ